MSGYTYEKFCGGCRIYEDVKHIPPEDRATDCAVARPGAVKSCPCKTCLVKMVCDLPCEKFDTLHRRIKNDDYMSM